jgi:hypothetical protein
MTTTDTYHYRGYEIVPTPQWASWCASIYPMRADLPLISRSTRAPRKEKAVAEAVQKIDRALAP